MWSFAGRTVAALLVAGGAAIGVIGAGSIAQRAAALGFFGSIAILIPPARQMVNNAAFRFLDDERAKSTQFVTARDAAGNERKVQFQGFSWYDAVMYAGGAMSLAGSFWLQY